MTVTPALNGQVIGQAHYATRAVLERELARTRTTFTQSVALNALATDGGSVDALVDRMTAALKVDQDVVHTTLTELVEARLVEAVPGRESEVRLTEAGGALQQQIQVAVREITARLYADLPASDVQAAARVLTELTTRANAELAN